MNHDLFEEVRTTIGAASAISEGVGFGCSEYPDSFCGAGLAIYDLLLSYHQQSYPWSIITRRS